MIRNLLNRVRWSSNFAAFNVSKCSYSNPVALSQRNLDFDLDLKDEELFKRNKTETRHIEVSLVDKLKNSFGCSETKAVDLLRKQEEISKTSLRKLGQVLDLLSTKGIRLRTILNHQWLFNLQPEQLKLSLSMIESTLEPRCFDDFIPFAKIPPIEFMAIQHKLLREKSTLPDGNRVYYLSRLLGAKPISVAECFVRCPKLFSKKIETLEEAVKILEEFKITSDEIIKSPYILYRTPKAIQKRLTMCQALGCNDPNPVYLKLSEKVFKARVKSRNEKTEAKPILKVLSERLGCHPDFLSTYSRSYKSLLSQTPEKINEKLDYLLIEANIPPTKVLSFLKILTFRTEVIRTRLDEMKSIGHHPTSMSIVGVSQQRFKKYFTKLRKTEESVELSAKL